MKQGSLETRMGQGEVKVGVPVQGCTECNKHQLSQPQSVETAIAMAAAKAFMEPWNGLQANTVKFKKYSNLEY